jgi:hypothetical protein
MLSRDSNSRVILWRVLALGLVLGPLAFVSPAPEAHQAITSPYTYNDHVFPIFRDRCGRCHFDGGPAMMSLLTYNDAIPWAESMREQLVGERMPPWYADPMGPAVKGGHTISPRELDIIVTWATGGVPQGELAKKPAKVPPPPQWRSGRPDLTIAMDQEHVVPANTMEENREFVLSTGLTETKWLKAVDLAPGTPSMVREALIVLDNGPVLAAWVPGHEAIAAPSGAAFKLPAGAKLRLQMRYRKHYLDEQNAVKDRSTIGLYFTDAPVSGREIEAFEIDGQVSGESTDPQTFSKALLTAARVVAIRPRLDQTYASVDVHAILPNAKRVALLLMRAPRAEWPRRYWLQEPIELPQGTRIEVTTTPAPANPDDIPSPRREKLQIAVDYVAQ